MRSASCLREGLQTLKLAAPGIIGSMVMVEAFKNIEENQSPIFPFSYCCQLRDVPLHSYITVKIVSPFVLSLVISELVMHVLIQVLAHKLDGPRGEVIVAENQVVTRRMHRRLVISETACFTVAICRVLFKIFIVHAFYGTTTRHILVFCGPSMLFFVRSTILTVLSADVRSSIFECFKYIRSFPPSFL